METPSECDVCESVIPLSQVLDVRERKPRCGVPFLNLSFTGKPLKDCTFSVIGPGVYGLFFAPLDGEKERLIYIGSFCGKKRNPFDGHIVTTRWWTHAASVTMRGNLVSIASRTSRKLKARLRATPSHDFHQLAAPSNPECLHERKRCDAGCNRVFFAESHWDLFGSANEKDILEPFQMAYLRLGSNPIGMDIGTLRARIKGIEDQLIADFRPVCNDGTTWGTARHDVTRDLFQREARRLLCDLWRPFR